MLHGQDGFRLAEQAAGKTTKVAGFERRRPVKEPFPEHLPRERVVVDAPACCSSCGSDRIVKTTMPYSESGRAFRSARICRQPGMFLSNTLTKTSSCRGDTKWASSCKMT